MVDTINKLYPHIQVDGGGMTLLNVTPRQVIVSLSGSCSGCTMTDMTLAWLRQKLMERTGTYMGMMVAPTVVNQSKGDTMKFVHPNSNTATRLDPMILDVMMSFLIDFYGNPSSIHDFGLPVQAVLEQAHQQVIVLLGADYPSETIFTSCATEATITAIASAVTLMPGRREIITSTVKHPATLAVCEQLEYQGCLIYRVAVDQQGTLDMTQFRMALSLCVALVGIMWANSETGVMFPAPELVELVHEQGTLSYCDVVQAVGKIPMTLSQTRIDILPCLTYKSHDPKGMGRPWLRHGVCSRPLLRGSHQAYGRWAGAGNISGIAGVGAVSELARAHPPGMAQISQLRDRLGQHPQVTTPAVTVMGGNRLWVSGIFNLAFECIEGEAIPLLMNQAEIAASSDSTCTSGLLGPPHVTWATNIPYITVHGTIRFSPPRYTREKEIDYVIIILLSAIDRLYVLPPYWQQGQPRL